MEAFFEHLPEIIAAASKSPLGIFALMISALSGIALVFFRHASEKIRLVVFALLFLGVAGYGFVVSVEFRSVIQRDNLAQAAKHWVAVANEAKASGVISAGVALPASVTYARAEFEQAWTDSTPSDRQKVDKNLLYDALSATLSVYSEQEKDSRKKAMSLRWADEAVYHFETILERELLGKALLDKAGLFIDFAQLEHTDADESRRVVETGDDIMARAISLVSEEEKPDALRIWSRFYYNLARPKSFRLSEDWDNDYLLLSHQKMKEAFELDLSNLKNATQHARIVQKTAANPPQDQDPKWTAIQRNTQKAFLAIWQKHNVSVREPTERIPPLNILAVITMETVIREWSELDGGQKSNRAESYLQELQDVALSSQREVVALLPKTHWKDEYDFDTYYDLARIYATRCQILEVYSPDRVEHEFWSVVKNMEKARAGASLTQIDAAKIDIEREPTLSQLKPEQRNTLRRVLDTGKGS
jgi:hypothetical protein